MDLMISIRRDWFSYERAWDL